MKRIPLFLLNILLMLILAALAAREPSETIKTFHLVNESMSWSEAQQHCRKRYTDLASVRMEDKDLVPRISNFPIMWIGLYRDDQNASVWKWSSGESATSTSDTNWLFGPTNGDCGFLILKDMRWYNEQCNRLLPFMCFTTTTTTTTTTPTTPTPAPTPTPTIPTPTPTPTPELVLVKENKTWEQALDHCRDMDVDSSLSDLYHEHLYDLVSLRSEDEHRHAKDIIQEASTNEVWTGLRFLAGEWLWVDGEPLEYQDLPLCPAWGQRCGTLPKDPRSQWETRDCMETRNFLCHPIESENDS